MNGIEAMAMILKVEGVDVTVCNRSHSLIQTTEKEYVRPIFHRIEGHKYSGTMTKMQFSRNRLSRSASSARVT